uniref:F-box/FBD/LRR-repeat protein At1g13570-like n=1 Tax=Nicotiana sylvestris TaxID=4096 RepID=A0A1U7WEA4_NICSY|nr:PREDICTED: F-box/FBD/LRR-repeat protein At1g13570-like [Nicotiana sylvestris]
MMNKIKRDEIDRISNLPKEIIHQIFKDMSFREVIRTCVLSKKWRKFWIAHPNLILDRQFFQETIGNRRMIEYNYFGDIVDKFLLQHIGSIDKFTLDMSIISFDNRDLDHWLLNVTIKNVKEVILDNYDNNPCTLPFCIFNCSTLTYLYITNCIVKPPYPTILFPNLLELNLKSIKFSQDIANHFFNIPLLSTLTFTSCSGIHFLNIFAPKVEFLTIYKSHKICANFLENFTNVKVLCIVIFIGEESENYEQERFITWSRLLFLCSNLRGLALSNSCIGLLGAENIPKRFPFKAYHLEDVNLRVEFGDIDQVSGVFSLIRSSPNLRSLEIDVFSSGSSIEVTDYLADPDCVDQQFERLEYVEVTEFQGTTSELIFLKLILANSPSLSKMIVGSYDELDVGKVRRVYELLRLSPNASPRVEIVVIPYDRDL